MYLLIIMEELVSNILISFDMSTNSTHMLYWIRLNNCQRLHISNFTRLPPNALHATIYRWSKRKPTKWQHHKTTCVNVGYHSRPVINAKYALQQQKQQMLDTVSFCFRVIISFYNNAVVLLQFCGTISLNIIAKRKWPHNRK